MLKIKDPRVVKTYLDILHAECSKGNIYELMDNLHSRMIPGILMIQSMVQEFEYRDKAIDIKVAFCEKSCRKFCSGTVPWLPAYKKRTYN